jgi:predicted permease
MLGGVWQDLRYGARMLTKTPGFTLLAVITLALGIGANTAIFSGINAWLFRPLPATREPERLCYVNIEGGNVSYAEYMDFQSRSRLLEGLAAYDRGTGRTAEWRFDGQYQPLLGDLVSGNYFQVLGATAALGRVLTPEDEIASAENAVVVSDATWRNYFAADPGIVGKQVLINDRGFTVVGVTAPAFQGPKQPNTPAWWIAARKAAAPNLFDNQGKEFNLIGRLKPGISSRQAQAELAVIFAGFKQLKPEAYEDRFVTVGPVRGFRMSSSERSKLYPMMAIAVAVVGLTLLIACANIASFLLTRAINRRREIAVRLALGASRSRIVRMLLVESLLLALLGGAAAAALSFWATDLLSYALSLIGSRSLRRDFSPEWRVFGATLLISLLVGVVCGLAPALQASKADLTAGLKDEAGSLSSRFRRLSWRNALVVAQVAGALVLLAGAGLFLRSARQALRFELGFDAHNLAFNQISIGGKNHSPQQAEQFFRDLQSRVAALTDVQSVCLAEGSLLDGQRYLRRHKLSLAGTEQTPFGDRELESFVISPNYFTTIGVPLTSGRDFAERDLAISSRVVIINESLAHRAFPGQNPVGRQVRLLTGLNRDNGEPLEIIGVAKDSTQHKLGEEIEPILYRPIKQYFGYRGNYTILIVRTRRDPAPIIPSVANLIKSLNPEVSFSQYTLAENMARLTLPSRVTSAFFGLFGALGLLLASVGLSGALAYAVARRTKEIGVRMALGADRAAVLRMIIGEGLALTLTGVVIGLLLALALTRALSSYLYGVGPADPLTYLATTLILIVVALLACYFPARRAACVDPMTALRHD